MPITARVRDDAEPRPVLPIHNPRRWLAITGGSFLVYVTAVIFAVLGWAPALPSRINVIVITAFAVGFLLAGSLVLASNARYRLTESNTDLIAAAVQEIRTDAALIAVELRRHLDSRLDAITNIHVEQSLTAAQTPPQTVVQEDITDLLTAVRDSLDATRADNVRAFELGREVARFRSVPTH